MSLLAHVKNVFDATIGDGKIRGAKKGAVALASPVAEAYFRKMKSELIQTKLQEHEVTVGDRATFVNVSVKLRVEFNGQDYKQTLHLSKDGKWNPKPPSESIIDM